MTEYSFLRELADSYGLIAMFIVFLILCAWPFRPGAQRDNNKAAQSIFEDNGDDE